MARYRAATLEVRDQTHASDDAEPIQTGELALRLVRARDRTDGFSALGVGETARFLALAQAPPPTVRTLAQAGA